MKLDVSLIEGYDTMTDAQKLEALLGFDLDPTKAGFKSQADFDKIMTENAEKKKRIKELEAKGASDKDELTKRLEQLEESNKQLTRERTIAANEAQYLAMGYDKDLAHEAAEAVADNDSSRMFAAQQKFIEAHDKKLKEEAMRKMTPPAGGSGGADDKDKDAIEIAKTFGKSIAESVKASDSVLSQYMIK